MKTKEVIYLLEKTEPFEGYTIEWYHKFAHTGNDNYVHMTLHVLDNAHSIAMDLNSGFEETVEEFQKGTTEIDRETFDNIYKTIVEDLNNASVL